MDIGLLLITHNNIGQQLLDVASETLGVCPLKTHVLAVNFDAKPDALKKQAHDMLKSLDRGSGVLVLTDIYGSTPSNIADSLADLDTVRVVSGVNLPMLIRTLNYANLSLDEIAEKAITGGHDGIIDYQVITRIDAA
ncbi:MAG: PTS sugar transporter subunit IIA [Gammaproteobacteria bacterium]|nr:PTS sugar transporter subunit IIA [Gammaproteobacteria bacterium]